MNKNKTQLSLIPKPNTLGNVFDKLTEDIWSAFDVFASPYNRDTLLRYPNGWFGNAFPEKYWQESDQAFTTEIEIPRFTKEDIKLSIEGNMLHINAEKDDKYRFYHSISIPDSADIGHDPDAKLDHGILTVSFKKKESAKPKRIEIK